MARRAWLHRVPMAAPDDVSGLRELVGSGRLAPDEIVAVLAKTEGNGCVNDFSRGFAARALRDLLSSHGVGEARIERIPLVMSGGTEGGLSPHWCVLGAGGEEGRSAAPSLAMAGTLTRALSPAEIGRTAQAELVRVAVREAMTAAEIATPDDVHFVQVKCPLLTLERVASVGGDVATRDTLKSMGLSRGASALGVALALGEIDGVSDERIGADTALWSTRASCSAGIETLRCEVVVLGQSPAWSGPLRIAHTVMRDAIDAPSVTALLERILGRPEPQAAPERLLAVLAKAEASGTGRIRGLRHTMLDDSDLSATRHARGFVAGMLAGLSGHTELFVSGGAEHQGPDGGGPLAVVYSAGDGTDA